MNNRRISEVGGGKFKTDRTNEPALETPNARVEQLGDFRVDSLAASQAAVAEKYQGVDTNASVGAVAVRAGHILYLAWQLSTAVTAGTLTAQVTVNGTALSTDVINLAGATSGVTQLSVPVAFVKGDKLGVKHTTNGGFTPTPHLSTTLGVRWTAIEDAIIDVL